MNNEALCKSLLSGVNSCLQNTDELINESYLLFENSHYSRAYFLLQIANEESAKMELLGTTYIQLVLNRPFDEKVVRSKFRLHESKNSINSYHMPFSDEEIRALRFSDPIKLNEIILHQKADYIKTRNIRKNDSLYVNWVNDKFDKPSEKITKKDVAELRNEVTTILAGRRKLVDILPNINKKRTLDGLCYNNR